MSDDRRVTKKMTLLYHNLDYKIVFILGEF